MSNSCQFIIFTVGGWSDSSSSLTHSLTMSKERLKRSRRTELTTGGWEQGTNRINRSTRPLLRITSLFSLYTLSLRRKEQDTNKRSASVIHRADVDPSFGGGAGSSSAIRSVRRLFLVIFLSTLKFSDYAIRHVSEYG